MSRTNTAGIVAHLSVLLLCGLLPFFFIPAAWASIAQAKMLLVIILAVVATVALLIGVLSGEFARVPKSPLLLAALLIPISYFISALATGASHTSFIGGGVQQDTVVAVVTWYALFVVCASVISTSTSRIISVLRTFIFGGVLVLAIQVARLAFPSFTFGDTLIGQTANVVGSWHDLAIFLGLFCFLAVALLPTPVARGALWKSFLLSIAVVSAGLLIVLNFKDGWFGLFGISIAYAAYLWFSGRHPHPSSLPEEQSELKLAFRPFAWIIIGLVALGLAFGGTMIKSLLPSVFQIAQIEVRPSWQGTYTIGSKVFSEPGSIFFGSGPNTFPRAWGLYKPIEVNQTQFWNIDFYSGIGFIPTSFVTVGLLGAMAWGAIGAALLFSIWKLVRRRAESVILGIMHGILVGSAVYLTVFHVLYVPSQTLSALTFLFFGLMVASGFLADPKRSAWELSLDTWKGRLGAGMIAVLAIIVLVGGIQSKPVLTSDIFVNRSVAIYNSTQDLSQASRMTALAVLAFPQNDRAHRAAVELGLLKLAELISSGDESETVRIELQNTLTTTIQHGLTAVSIESTNYQNWLSLAQLYRELAGVGLEGAEEQARTAYEEARRSNPTNPLPFMGLAQLDLLKGDDDSARAHLKAALELKPNLAMALFILSQTDARAGDLSLARESAEMVIRIVPEDPLGWYNLGTIYYVDRDYQNASLVFERAVGLQNDYANALFLLGMSYASLEREDDALAVFRAVAALDPSKELPQNIIAELEAGNNPFAPPAADE